MRIDFPDNPATRQQVDSILAQHGIIAVPLDAPHTTASPSILNPVAEGYTAILVPDGAPAAMLAALAQVPGLTLQQIAKQLRMHA